MEAWFEQQLKHLSFSDSSWCLMNPDPNELLTCCTDDRVGNPNCSGCKKRFNNRQGAPIPTELQKTRFDNFNVWKDFQHIEVYRLTGRYTDEQAKIARKHYTNYLLNFLENDKNRQAEAKEHQNILTKLFGNSE